MLEEKIAIKKHQLSLGSESIGWTIVGNSNLKQTEIGVIPVDWEVKELGDVLTFGSGRDYKHLKNGDIPVYGTGGIMTYVDDFLYQGESVGIGRKGTIDKPVYLTDKFWTVDTLFYTHNFKSVLPKYVFYQFGRIPWKEYNEASGVPSLNKNTLSNIQIPLPPLAEQEAIAAALSDADAWIESLEQLIAKKRLIKQGAMQTLLTPKEDWEVKKLGEVAEIVTGNTPSTRDETNYGDEYLFISPADLGENKYIVNSEKKLSKKGFSLTRKLKQNAILVTCIGSTIGKIGIAKFECCTNQQINSLITNSDNNFEFVYYLLALNADIIKQNASQQAVPLLNKTDFSELEFRFPLPLSEQERIATILSDMDVELESLANQLAKARQIKQGMMQELLTGRTRLV